MVYNSCQKVVASPAGSSESTGDGKGYPGSMEMARPAERFSFLSLFSPGSVPPPPLHISHCQESPGAQGLFHFAPTHAIMALPHSTENVLPTSTQCFLPQRIGEGETWFLVANRFIKMSISSLPQSFPAYLALLFKAAEIKKEKSFIDSEQPFTQGWPRMWLIFSLYLLTRPTFQWFGTLIIPKNRG